MHTTEPTTAAAGPGPVAIGGWIIKLWSRLRETKQMQLLPLHNRCSQCTFLNWPSTTLNTLLPSLFMEVENATVASATRNFSFWHHLHYINTTFTHHTAHDTFPIPRFTEAGIILGLAMHFELFNHKWVLTETLLFCKHLNILARWYINQLTKINKIFNDN